MHTIDIESTQTLEALSEKIESVTKEFGLSVITTHPFHEILNSKGFPTDKKAFVFEVCQPKMASKMIENNIYFTPFMPCRIAMYEDQGKVKVSTQNLMPMIDGLEEGELKAEAKQLFGKLGDLLERLK